MAITCGNTYVMKVKISSSQNNFDHTFFLNKNILLIIPLENNFRIIILTLFLIV